MVKLWIPMLILITALSVFGENHESILQSEKRDTLEFHPAKLDSAKDRDPNIGLQKDRILSFADYLFEEGEFQRASTEYHRYCFSFPEDPNKTYSIFRIGLSHEKLAEFRLARKYYHNLVDGGAEAKWTSSAYYRIASTHYEEQNWVKAITYIDSLEKEEGKLGGGFDYLRGWCYLHIKRYNDAQTIFERLNESDIEQRLSSLYYLISKTKQAQIMTRKSPLLAGIFSTLLPGSGQLYCKRWGDAGYSFTLTLGCASSSYFLWEDDKPFAVTMAVLGSFFYLGNIYGAVASADIYNEKSHSEFIRKTEEGVPHKPTELFQKP